MKFHVRVVNFPVNYEGVIGKKRKERKKEMFKKFNVRVNLTLL